MINYLKNILKNRSSNIDWGLLYNSNYPFEHKPIINLIQQIHKKYKIELNNKSVKNKAWYNINLELNSFWYDFKESNSCTITMNYISIQGNWEIMDWERIRIGFNNEKKEYFSLFFDNQIWILGNPFDLLILSSQNIPINTKLIEKYIYDRYLSPNPGNILFPSM